MDSIEEAPEPSKRDKAKGGRPRLKSLRSGIIKDKLLQGVSEHYCRHFAQTEWNVTRACARRYIFLAKKLIGIDAKPYTDDIFLDHLAMRRDLRKRANESGDLKLVLEIVKDEAALLALYEVKKKPVAVTTDEDTKPNNIEEVLLSPDVKSMSKPADPATS